MKHNENNIFPFVVGTIVGPILVFLIVEVMALFEDNPNAKFAFLKSADKWIALIGATLSYVGTCFVGIVAMWQNKELNKVNEKLLMIEQRRLIPRLTCKANNIRHLNGKTRLYFQVKHIDGEAAINIEIRNIILLCEGKEIPCATNWLGSAGNLCEGYQTYWVECEDVINEQNDVEMQFSLRFSDIMEISHEIYNCIRWEHKTLDRYGGHNNVSQNREDSNDREPVAMC